MDRHRPNVTAHLGYWSAAAASVLAFFSAAVLYFLDERWTNLTDYVNTYRDIRMFAYAFWLGMAPLVVVAMGSLHALAEGPKRAFSRLAFGFTLPYAAIVGVTYYLQVTYVRQRILGGFYGPDFELWVVASPNSILFSINLLGFFFLGLSTLFAAPLFGGSRLESGLRALLVLHGVMAVVGLVIPVLAPPTTPEAQRIGGLLLIVWCVTFGTIMSLLSVLFRHLAGFMVTVQKPTATQSTVLRGATHEPGQPSFSRPPSAFK